MKKVITILMILASVPIIAQVAIPDETKIDNSAALRVYSEDKGILIPRLSHLEMLAIKNPATGLWIYNKDQNDFYYYDGEDWLSMSKPPIDSLSDRTASFVGEYYYNTIDSVLLYWNGTSWVKLKINE